MKLEIGRSSFNHLFLRDKEVLHKLNLGGTFFPFTDNIREDILNKVVSACISEILLILLCKNKQTFRITHWEALTPGLKIYFGCTLYDFCNC